MGWDWMSVVLPAPVYTISTCRMIKFKESHVKCRLCWKIPILTAILSNNTDRICAGLCLAQLTGE
jgi:hypothetical protein